jgi:hypothetical protein
VLIPVLTLIAMVSASSTYQATQDTSQYYAHGAFAQIDQHSAAPARIRSLCAHGRPADFNHLADLQDRLAHQLERDSSLGTIEDLACARALLVALNARAREGPGMPFGQSWADGAISAAIRGLQQFPDNADLAELLGIVLQETMPTRYPEAADPSGEPIGTPNADVPAAAAAIYGAIELGARSPGLLRSCTSLMLDLNDVPAAHDCSLRALTEGHDSTWHLLRLASLAFIGADTVTGMKAIELAATSAHDASSRAELGWHLESVGPQCTCIVAGAMNPSSRAGYDPRDNLSAAERREWLALPDSSVGDWITAAIRARLPLPKAGEAYGRMHRLATPTQNAVWQHASLIPADFLLHFFYTSYGGGTFRGCLSALDTITCRPPPNPDDKHHIALAADVWRLWDPVSGARIQLLGLAVPIRGMAFVGRGADRSATVDINFRQWTLPGAWRDTAFVRQIRVPESAGDDGTWLASVIIPGAELPSWGLMVSQSTLRRGGLYRDLRPAINETDLELSDLVLGSPEQRLAWQNGVTTVPLAPVHAFSQKKTIQLYYQIRADTTRPSIKVAITVRRIVDGLPSEQTVVSMSFAAAVKRGINEAQRELDLSNLASGDYELSVDIQRPDGVRVHRTTQVAVR